MRNIVTAIRVRNEHLGGSPTCHNDARGLIGRVSEEVLNSCCNVICSRWQKWSRNENCICDIVVVGVQVGTERVVTIRGWHLKGHVLPETASCSCRGWEVHCEVVAGTQLRRETEHYRWIQNESRWLDHHIDQGGTWGGKGQVPCLSCGAGTYVTFDTLGTYRPDNQWEGLSYLHLAWLTYLEAQGNGGIWGPRAARWIRIESTVSKVRQRHCRSCHTDSETMVTSHHNTSLEWCI